jgi:hypothetical protein
VDIRPEIKSEEETPVHHRLSARALVLPFAIAALAAGCSTDDMKAADAKAKSPMTFFVTSVGSGTGADFGGLAGADAHCQKLAAAVGAGGRTWRAYLSASPTATTQAVNARDRIGTGPWQNAQGDVVARSVADLHGDANNLNKQTAITEKGAVVNGRGDNPNKHDILTGSQRDGTAFAGAEDRTCGNWTKSGDGTAIVGHHDRTGTNPDPVANVSWNSSHPSAGCSDPLLVKTGGAGLLYCFAVN